MVGDTDVEGVMSRILSTPRPQTSDMPNPLRSPRALDWVGSRRLGMCWNLHLGAKWRIGFCLVGINRRHSPCRSISPITTSYFPYYSFTVQRQTSDPPNPLGSPQRSIGLDRVGWVCRRNRHLMAKWSVGFWWDMVKEGTVDIFVIWRAK